MNDSFTTRFATEHDQNAIINLIDSVYHEYGDEVCLTGADQDLLDIKSTYFDRGGVFWVMENKEQQIIGTHAAKPLSPAELSNNPTVQACTFRRLYLHPSQRGTQCGVELMELAFNWARQNHFDRVQFWSDTRFSRAHRFFKKLGFHHLDEVRQMDDGQTPYSEFFFFIDLK